MNTADDVFNADKPSALHALPSALALVTTLKPSSPHPAAEHISSSPVADNSVNVNMVHLQATLACLHASVHTVPSALPIIGVADQVMGNVSLEPVDYNNAMPPELMVTKTNNQIVPPQSEHHGVDKAMSVHSHDAEGDQDDLPPIPAPRPATRRQPCGDPVAGPPDSVLSLQYTHMGLHIDSA